MFNALINLGNKSSYLPWEVSLTRKLNMMALIGIFNVSIAIFYYLLIGYYEFMPECLLVLGVSPFVFIANRYGNYIWAAYVFNLIGYIFFTIMNLRMGRDSFMILFFFPFIISMIQILGRKETLVHLFIMLFLCFGVITFILVGNSMDLLKVHIEEKTFDNIKYINILLSFSVTIAFIIAVVSESAKQEKLIKETLKEKEILLAEVFHRVKNNMNIVTSLLNLKKNVSESNETREALEECKNRVYSMALVHQKIYLNNSLSSLNFREYIDDLVKELINSFNGNNNIDVTINAHDVLLELSNAIPCGLIVNELITNSVKHAQQPGKKLNIEIHLFEKNNKVEISVKDNGPGLKGEQSTVAGSLGMELIKSLSDQIDANYSFQNNNGLEFKLSFLQKQQ